MSFTGGRLKLKGDDTGVKKEKKRKSKAEDESKALQLAEEATEPDAMPKVLLLSQQRLVYISCTSHLMPTLTSAVPVAYWPTVRIHAMAPGGLGLQE